MIRRKEKKNCSEKRISCQNDRKGSKKDKKGFPKEKRKLTKERKTYSEKKRRLSKSNINWPRSRNRLKEPVKACKIGKMNLKRERMIFNWGKKNQSPKRSHKGRMHQEVGTEGRRRGII